MIIKSSAVGMNSSRVYNSMTQASTASIITKSDQAEKLNLSEDSETDALTQLENAKKELEAQKKQTQEKNAARMINGLLSSDQAMNESSMEIRSMDDFKSEVVRVMLEALIRVGKSRNGAGSGNLSGFSSLVGLSGMKAAYQSSSSFKSSSISILAGAGGSGSSGGSAPNVTTWKKTTAASVFFAEAEVTKYSAAGIARTEDGREINFGVSIEMSRGFSAHFNSFTQEDYICTDPLVINVGSDFAGVTDQKFAFDLDADGKAEEISFAANGSGFLALDKNGDGKINDGSELFGTKSGDGFADLAQYDKDGNGWIDEADEVFSKLKIWTKDENGNDRMISLKEAGVGAIFLGSSDTEFSLKNGETNATNAVVRKTGVYLKENGGVGTIQHVDLAT